MRAVASAGDPGESAGTEQPWAVFRAALVDEGVLLATDVDGVYGRSATYESVVEAFERVILRVGADQEAVSLRFPPVMPWSTFVKTGYLESFPDQMGSVQTFGGDDRLHAELVHRAGTGEDRGSLLETVDVALCPAVCHPVYPTQSGRLPEGGRRVEVYGYCFRHEPSADPFRMQSFRQHDYVYLGTPEGALAHHDQWIDRGLEVFGALGLEAESVVGTDPFFGRSGRMLAANQRSQKLKHELVVPVFATGRPTAIASSNSHLDHFSRPFGIDTATGDPAHTACFGFGVDRIALALLDRHGLDPNQWPAGVRSILWP